TPRRRQRTKPHWDREWELQGSLLPPLPESVPLLDRTTPAYPRHSPRQSARLLEALRSIPKGGSSDYAHDNLSMAPTDPSERAVCGYDGYLLPLPDRTMPTLAAHGRSNPPGFQSAFPPHRACPLPLQNFFVASSAIPFPIIANFCLRLNFLISRSLTNASERVRPSSVQTRENGPRPRVYLAPLPLSCCWIRF